MTHWTTRRRDNVAGERLVLDNHPGRPVGYVDAWVHSPIVGASQPRRRRSLNVGKLIRTDAEAARKRANACRNACPVRKDVRSGRRQVGVGSLKVVHAAGVQCRVVP